MYRSGSPKKLTVLASCCRVANTCVAMLMAHHQNCCALLSQATRPASLAKSCLALRQPLATSAAPAGLKKLADQYRQVSEVLPRPATFPAQPASALLFRPSGPPAHLCRGSSRTRARQPQAKGQTSRLQLQPQLGHIRVCSLCFTASARLATEPARLSWDINMDMLRQE